MFVFTSVCTLTMYRAPLRRDVYSLRCDVLVYRYFVDIGSFVGAFTAIISDYVCGSDVTSVFAF